MQTSLVRRHYDEIIASHYDFDPQSMIGDSLNKALNQIERHVPSSAALKVLDVGVGTGRFLEKLRADWDIEPYGLDLSRKMIDIAHKRLPDLESAIDDAINLGAHFAGVEFDLACTHFLTGFVALDVLAPRIVGKIRPGGLWSYIGGTQEGFPVLLRKANTKLCRWLFGIERLEVAQFVKNPANEQEVSLTLDQHGLEILQCETIRPGASFKDLKEFLEFGYYGGWLTPFIEAIHLHQASALTRIILNGVFFPIGDHHSIVVALARKKE
jgi:SAM-dependent methyltransferase